MAGSLFDLIEDPTPRRPLSNAPALLPKRPCNCGRDHDSPESRAHGALVRATTRAEHGPYLVCLAKRDAQYEYIAYWWARDAGRLANRALDLAAQAGEDAA